MHIHVYTYVYIYIHNDSTYFYVHTSTYLYVYARHIGYIHTHTPTVPYKEALPPTLGYAHTPLISRPACKQDTCSYNTAYAGGASWASTSRLLQELRQQSLEAHPCLDLPMYFVSGFGFGMDVLIGRSSSEPKKAPKRNYIEVTSCSWAPASRLLCGGGKAVRMKVHDAGCHAIVPYT